MSDSWYVSSWGLARHPIFSEALLLQAEGGPVHGVGLVAVCFQLGHTVCLRLDPS